jgi:LysR family transcriptional activator of nhaA
MDQLNYHHLRYFREVATEGNLSRAAQRLNVSQSALSMQIRNLEERLGHALFERVGRKLVLTEVGHIALDHADRIFTAGEELLATLSQDRTVASPIAGRCLVHAVAQLPDGVSASLACDGKAGIVLRSGNTTTLLDDLTSLALDVVLTTEPPQAEQGSQFASQRIAEQQVALHGTPDRLKHASLKQLLRNEPVILPTDSAIRAGFESLIGKLGISPRVAALVDDMAMVRLLAREGAGLAVAPPVVVADEISSGLLQTAPFPLGIVEPFYAVTVARKYPHPMLAELLSHGGTL